MLSSSAAVLTFGCRPPVSHGPAANAARPLVTSQDWSPCVRMKVLFQNIFPAMWCHVKVTLQKRSSQRCFWQDVLVTECGQDQVKLTVQNSSPDFLYHVLCFHNVPVPRHGWGLLLCICYRVADWLKSKHLYMWAFQCKSHTVS